MFNLDKKGEITLTISAALIGVTAFILFTNDFVNGNGFEEVELKDRCGFEVTHADEINSKTKQCP